MLILDSSHAVIAQTTDPAYCPPGGYVVVEAAPADFDFASAAEWAWNGAALVHDPALVLARVKAQRLSDLAAYRYTQETGGITLNGATIKTDLESQAKINGAWSAAQMNPAILIDWKGANGWIQIDAATITAIAMSVANHVQACFSNERVHAEAIALFATTEEIQAYDFTTGWPE